MNTLKSITTALATWGLIATAAACGAAETPVQQIGEQAPAETPRTESPRGIPSAENEGSTGNADDRRWDGTLRANIPD
jgi:hypothetical protein